MKSILAVAAAGLLGGAAAAGTYLETIDPPQHAEFQVTTAAPAQTIHDPQDVLSPGDEQRLEQEIVTPDVIKEVHYVVFAHNRENVKDTLEEYLRAEVPNTIGQDSYADGVLIVGVGLDPRQSFVGAGDDVAAALDLKESDHLDETLEAIKPGVKDGNIPAGLQAGLREAINTEGLYDSAREDYTIGAVGSGAAGAGFAAAGVGGVIATRNSRRKRIAQAREDHHALVTEYTSVASRLDSLDIRAHSLSSALVDATLRQQWEEVRDRFLALNSTVDSLPVTAASSDKEFLKAAKQLREAAETMEDTTTAEDNIETIFALENGDEPARAAQVRAMDEDAAEAQLKLDDASDPAYVHLDAVRKELAALDTASDDFVERYVDILKDYQRALTAVQERKFSDAKGAPEAPGLTSPDYRPGYGINGFVPYVSMSNWHATHVASSQSSSTNTSFSSGFSGAGGSSSF
ncbi:DUF5129 domain-containing protein [Corynebacterium tapiri]|uniref:DUF5129 domain-containing protein n=1 Tax=Corynebacterium tapiri TaxID=1448266 RepID=A0A5C4U5X0_9CORY|nr:DUF5129 domain-containing protein [Corynebacterium tapiri]TNL99282.1 DUF5129 domain-containing protein [Corynebacterium tapiri]